MKPVLFFIVGAIVSFLLVSAGAKPDVAKAKSKRFEITVMSAGTEWVVLDTWTGTVKVNFHHYSAVYSYDDGYSKQEKLYRDGKLVK